MDNTEKATCYDTLLHIKKVSELLNTVISELMKRAERHDNSKLEEPELSVFIKYTPKLAETTYGNDEYKQFLKEMKPALDHHYMNNRHHPEFFNTEASATFRATPVNCMTIIDIIEMLCDWYAATMRHNDGDILKSININQERFGLTEQLTSILKNTVKMWEEK